MEIIQKLPVIALALIALISCGLNDRPVNKIQIGKYDSSVKGTIKEDLPTFTSDELQIAIKIPEIGELLRWQHQDLDLSGNYGVSADKAYSEFSLKQSRKIIVAVIDSGVDVKHEDLKDVIWINNKEIAGNNIDDDKNGYIDDIHGWNFIGGKDGRHVDAETLEETRVYKTLNTKLNAGHILTKDEKKTYEKVKKEVLENLAKYTIQYNEAKTDDKLVRGYKIFLQARLGIQKIETKKDIQAIETGDDEKLIKIKDDLLVLWEKYWRGFKGITKVLDSAGYYVNTGYNINFNARKDIVGDDPTNFSDTNYGNNDVTGPDAGHGTHVAGIIAAKRDNGIGMNGIASNVEIMALRVVPNGDERDKDIALAVRYAVDNGASIINMSFGKKYSPYKTQVDEAFEYAVKKGVLLFHSAGNSSLDNDGGKTSYPNSYLKSGFGVLQVNSINNWLEVGANTKELGINLVAEFSNYGAEAVSLFSPGHKIFSTTPNDKYEAFSGTSMAAPVAAGVAALLMSEFPSMTPKEAMKILLHTVSKPEGLAVRKPSPDRRNPDFRIPVPFSTLSLSGGLINAYNAIKLAKELSL